MANINIFASRARSQHSHYCHSLGAALLKGGPYVNIYFVRSRTEHEINNSHAFSFPFTSWGSSFIGALVVYFLFFCKQRPVRKQLEASLWISLAFTRKTLWLPVVVEEAVDKSWERRRSGTTKLVPLKALDVVPFHVSGIGALKSITDCYLAFQVGHRALVAHGVHVAVFILAHLLLTWTHGLFWCFHVWRRWGGQLRWLGGAEAYIVSLQHGGNPWRQ